MGTYIGRSLIIALALAAALLAAFIGIHYSYEPPSAVGTDVAAVIRVMPVFIDGVADQGRELSMSLFVTAPLPPGMMNGSGEDTEVVYSGPADGPVVISREKLGPIIEGWVKAYRERGSNPPYVGLTVSVSIIDKARGKLVAAGVNSITLDIKALSEGKVGVYTLVVRPSTDAPGLLSVSVANVQYLNEAEAAGVIG